MNFPKEFQEYLEGGKGYPETGIEFSIPITKERAAVTTTVGADHMTEKIIYTRAPNNSKSKLDALGITFIYDSPEDAVTMRYSAAEIGEVAEGGTIPDIVLTHGGKGEDPIRNGVNLEITRELIATSHLLQELPRIANEAFMNGVLKRVTEELSALSAVATWDTGDVAQALTVAAIADFKKDLKALNAPIKGFISAEVAAKLDQTEAWTGGGRSVIQAAPIPFVDSQYLGDQYGVIGDFSMMAVSLPSKLDILVDNYTQKDLGIVEIMISGMLRYDIIDSGAFLVLKKIDVS